MLELEEVIDELKVESDVDKDETSELEAITEASFDTLYVDNAYPKNNDYNIDYSNSDHSISN